MRVPTARKTFRRIPKVSPRMTTSTSSKPNWSKGFKTIGKAVNKLPEVQKFRESLANEPIETLVNLAEKAAKSRKRVEGATGLSLIPTDTRQVSISAKAANDFTTSANMYMYRPPRKRVEDAMKYVMKRSVTGTSTGDVNVNSIYDLNILDAKPVKDNPGSDSDYTPMSIERAFNNYLEGRTYINSGGSGFLARTEQADIHVKSLTIDLTFSNLYSTGVLIDVYELVPQFDLSSSTYESANYAPGYMSPYWTCTEGVSSSNVQQTDNTLAVTNLAFIPSNSTYFQRCWKKVKHLRLNMQSNGVHRHKSVHQINKTVTYQQMAQVSDDGGKFAGWNPSFLIIQRGIPTAGEQASASSIRYSCNIQLNYEATPDKQNKVIVFDSHT